jgi:hypothetical protein
MQPETPPDNNPNQRLTGMPPRFQIIFMVMIIVLLLASVLLRSL